MPSICNGKVPNNTARPRRVRTGARDTAERSEEQPSHKRMQERKRGKRGGLRKRATEKGGGRKNSRETGDDGSCRLQSTAEARTPLRARAPANPPTRPPAHPQSAHLIGTHARTHDLSCIVQAPVQRFANPPGPHPLSAGRERQAPAATRTVPRRTDAHTLTDARLDAHALARDQTLCVEGRSPSSKRRYRRCKSNPRGDRNKQAARMKLREMRCQSEPYG